MKDHLYIFYLKTQRYIYSIYHTDPIKALHPTKGSAIPNPRRSKPATAKYPYKQHTSEWAN